MAVAGKENCKRALEKLGSIANYEEEALKSVMEFESMSQGGCELLVFYFSIRHDPHPDSKAAADCRLYYSCSLPPLTTTPVWDE
jgi:hypothetical protein